MIPVNNSSDPSTKLSSLVLNMLSALNQGTNTQGLFDDLLSQTETEVPVQQKPANGQQGPVVQNNSSPSQNNTTDASNDPASGKAPQTNTVKTGADWGLLRKFVKHEAARQSSDKKAVGSTTNNQSAANTTTPANAKTDDQTSAADATPPAPTNNIMTVASDGTATDDTQDNTAKAVAQTASADVTVAAATAAAPQTTNPTSPTATGKDDPSTGDITDAELLMLLVQLERVAAAQLNLPTGDGTTGPAATDATQNTPSDPNQAAQGSANNPQDKVDLKGLLAALASLNNGGDGGDAQSAATTAATQSLAASFPALAASLQATASSSTSSHASADGTDKWMNAEFLNLFNNANANPNDAATPIAFNPALTANLAADGGDGASLDADGQGGGANLRSGGDGTSSVSNNTASVAAGPQQTSSPYDFASQLSALRATKGGPTGLPPAVEQVVLQLSRGLSKDGSSQMTIQLRPAELGRVDVKLNVTSDGKVQGTVTADNPATLNLLLKDVRGLERALQEAGLRADPGSLQFNLRGDGQAGGGFNQNANNSSGSNGGAGGAMTAFTAAADAPETYYLTPGGVNMRV